MYDLLFLGSETWHLVSQGGSETPPPARHRHSAVLHDNAMWVFGGMTDLQEKSGLASNSTLFFKPFVRKETIDLPRGGKINDQTNGEDISIPSSKSLVSV